MPVPGVGLSLMLVVADALEAGRETLMIGVAVTVACEKRWCISVSSLKKKRRVEIKCL